MIVEGYGIERLPPTDVGVDPAAVEYLHALCDELGTLNPKSYGYGVMAREITGLATEVGYPLALFPHGERVNLDDVAIPPAFVGATAISEIEIPGDQFTNMEPLLKDDTYVVDGVELMTDTDKLVRVVDLRPNLSPVLGDLAPDEAEGRRLDSHFHHDLRILLDKGWARNTVHRNSGSSGPCYSRYVGSKGRAFWGPVRVAEQGGNHVLTVARFADNGNSTSKEVALYRRLFGLTARNIN
jgi:hypothetical protein